MKLNLHPINLDLSTQINNGLAETSSDGASLAFDTKYGIMFCAYMPGRHGAYGESRGKIGLSYFPASQPTNIRYVTIAEGHTEYVPNIISLGDGKVRVSYEINARDEGDHPVCYKDFNYLTGELSEEKTIMVKKANGELVGLCQSVEFEYLDENGYHEHHYNRTEQIIFGGHTPFRDENGTVYGAITTEYSEVILYRSDDDMATLEFFAVFPEPVTYEFDFKYLGGRLHALYRTHYDKDNNRYAYSDDNGKTWSTPIVLADSIGCRPRMIVHNDHILMAYNVYNNDTGNRHTIPGGRCELRICLGEEENPNSNTCVADIQTKYGIVNIALVDIMGDAYMAYSTSQCALEYHNGNSAIRGKDAIRYIKLGDLTTKA